MSGWKSRRVAPIVDELEEAKPKYDGSDDDEGEGGKDVVVGAAAGWMGTVGIVVVASPCKEAGRRAADAACAGLPAKTTGAQAELVDEGLLLTDAAAAG